MTYPLGMWYWVVILGLLLVYVYVGYPLIIQMMSCWLGTNVQKGPIPSGGASVVIAAYNERDALPGKICRLLELAQTEPVAEILIGLDGCTDGTREAVENVLPKEKALPVRVVVKAFSPRRGKAAVLNELLPLAASPLVVLMDARQQVENGAISRLLENFADPAVGVASGELLFAPPQGREAPQLESYWIYEKRIRLAESRIRAVPGATGAFYAIRRELWQPIPVETLDDDVLIPMRAVLKGFRCIFDPQARVIDQPEARLDREEIRKRRTLAGIWQLICMEPEIFSPFANPIWIQFISHKFLRLGTPFLLLALVCLFLAISLQGNKIALVLLLLFLGGGGLGFYAWIQKDKQSLRRLRWLGAFWGMNWVLVLAAYDAAMGRFNAKWHSVSTSDF